MLHTMIWVLKGWRITIQNTEIMVVLEAQPFGIEGGSFVMMELIYLRITQGEAIQTDTLLGMFVKESG